MLSFRVWGLGLQGLGFRLRGLLFRFQGFRAFQVKWEPRKAKPE